MLSGDPFTHDDHTLALKNDGTLWAWGANDYGQLGLGDTARRLSPAQVGTDADWEAIAAGDDYSAALKTDSTLWVWGRNQSGQLGTGDMTERRRAGPGDHFVRRRHVLGLRLRQRPRLQPHARGQDRRHPVGLGQQRHR